MRYFSMADKIDSRGCWMVSISIPCTQMVMNLKEKGEQQAMYTAVRHVCCPSGYTQSTMIKSHLQKLEGFYTIKVLLLLSQISSY